MKTTKLLENLPHKEIARATTVYNKGFLSSINLLRTLNSAIFCGDIISFRYFKHFFTPLLYSGLVPIRKHNLWNKWGMLVQNERRGLRFPCLQSNRVIVVNNRSNRGFSSTAGMAAPLPRTHCHLVFYHMDSARADSGDRAE